MTATPSSRLSLWYRVPLVLLYVAITGAVGPAGPALADATIASPSPGEPCHQNDLDVSAPLNPVTSVFAPGEVGTQQASLHNATSVDYTDAYFQFELIAPHAATAATTAPSMSWSIDGGGWPGLKLSWVGVPLPTSSVWRSDQITLPTIAAGSTHTLRFQVSFHADSPGGWYDTDLWIGAPPCQIGRLGETTNMTYSYFTDGGRAGFGGLNSPTPGKVGAGRPASVPPTAPVSAIPGKPSAPPAPTDPITPVVAATPSPSARPVLNESSGATTAGPPRIAWLGGLVSLAVAALLGLWGRFGVSRRPPRTATDDYPTTEPPDRDR